jgi:hypothetical protein
MMLTPTIAIVDLSYAGSGCPQGSAAMNISPDNLAFTLLFDSFVVEGRPDSGNDVAAGCVATATVDEPAGWQFSVVRIDTRGFASVATKNASVEARLNVRLDGVGRPANGRLRLRGPYSADFQLSAELQGNGGRWSSCNGTRHTIVVDSELKLRRETLAAVDSLDGEAQVGTIAWQHCP